MPEKRWSAQKILRYFIWAAVLGEPEVRSSFIETNKKAGKQAYCEWKHPTLRARYHYESFQQAE